MKKKVYAFLLLTFIFTLKTYSQELYSIVPMQAGTINIASGKAIINLSDEIKDLLKDAERAASYYVIFTPVDNAVSPSISNKTINSFTVVVQKQNNSQMNNSVDYVVFVKRKVLQLSTQKLIKPALHN